MFITIRQNFEKGARTKGRRLGMVKAILGYDIMPEMSVEAYEKWLREVHLPDLSRIPGLRRVVFNTVKGTVRGIRPFTELPNSITTTWTPSRGLGNGERQTRFQKSEALMEKQISGFMWSVNRRKWNSIDDRQRSHGSSR